MTDTLFWPLAAALIGIGTLILVVPLWRKRTPDAAGRAAGTAAVARQRLREITDDRDSGRITAAEFEALRAELELALALDLETAQTAGRQRRSPRLFSTAVVAIAVPAISTSMYFLVGSPDQSGSSETEASAATAPDSSRVPPIREMVDGLARRLQENPDDAQGWLMLARSYLVLERFAEADAAFSRLATLGAATPDILAQHAGAIAMANGGEVTERASALLQQALAMDPDEARGLWLAGIFEMQHEDPAGALEYWRRLRPVLAGEPEAAANLAAMIGDAEQQLSLATAAGAPTRSTGDPVSLPGNDLKVALSVTVSLDAQLAAGVEPDDTVFVSARAVNGPSLPLAVARLKASELPATVALSDAMAMTPELRLSAFDQVRIVARVSRSGDALPRSGDLQGDAGPVSTARTEPIEIVIARSLP